LHQIRAANRMLAEAQVGDRARAGLSGVVDEVPLRVEIGSLTDDLDRVLVRAHRAVGAEAPEHGGMNTLRLAGPVIVPFQARSGHIIDDADREVVLGPAGSQIVEHGFSHARIEFLGAEAVAPAHDHRRFRQRAFLHGLINGRPHIQVHRLTGRTGFLGAVEHGDLLDRLGQRRHEGVVVKGPVQPHLNDAHLLAAGLELLHHFVDSLRAGTHDHNHALGIGRANVIEQVIFPARQLRQFVHALLHDPGCRTIVTVYRLAALEVDIRILGGAADGRAIRA